MATTKSQRNWPATLLCVFLAFSYNGVCQQEPSSTREIATAGKITSYIEPGRERYFDQIVLLRAADAKAFANSSPDLIKVTEGTRAILTSRMPRSRKINYVGTVNSHIVYVGSAALSDEWKLKTEFELQREIASIRSIRPDYKGLDVLAKRMAALDALRGQFSSAPMGEMLIHPDVTGTFRRHIEANMTPILGMLAMELKALPGDDTGIAKFPALYSEITDLIGRFTKPDGARLAAIRDEARADLHKRAFLHSAAKLRSAEMTWRTAPSVRDGFSRLSAALKSAGDEAGAAKLTAAIDQHIQKFVDGTGGAAFASELSSLPPDWDGIEKVIAMSSDLEKAVEKEDRLAALRVPLHGRAAEMAAAREAEFLASLADYGPHHSEVPFLIEDADEEAAHFRAIGADAAAEKILNAAIERGRVILAGSRNDFSAEVDALSSTHSTVVELTAQAQAFEVMAELIDGYKTYAELTRKRLDAIKGEMVNLIFQRSGLPREAIPLPIFDGKGGMTIGEFAFLADAARHRVTEIDLAERNNPAGRALSVKVPAASAKKALTALRVKMADESQVFIKFNEVETPKGWVFVAEARAANDGIVQPISADEWQRLRTSIARQVPTGIIGVDGLTEADHLAADPGDPRRVTAGVPLDALDLNAALEASIAALERNPEEPRFYFYCGRLLLAADDSKNAEPFLKLALAKGYPAAGAALGEMALGQVDFEGSERATVLVSKLEEAVNYFTKASAIGHQDAQERVGALRATLESAKSRLLPDYTERFMKRPLIMKALYESDTAKLDDQNTDKQAVRYYILGIRSFLIGAEFVSEDSSMSREFLKYAPISVQRLSSASNEPSGQSNNLFSVLFGIMQDTEILTSAYVSGIAAGEGDAGYIVDFFEDDNDLTRLYAQMLSFLQRNFTTGGGGVR